MKTEDIKKMAQAWLQVQEASYGKKKMEASDTQMGTITVKTDAEREARAKAYRDKKKAETNEAMDPVNPKELKGKHKDRKDKDINNDGKVDSTDKYLHARRKAVSAAIKGKKKDQEVEVQTSEAKIDEVLDTPKAMNSYRNKANRSLDRASNSAIAKMLRNPKGPQATDISKETETMDKRKKGLKMADKAAAKKTRAMLMKKEEVELDELKKSTLSSYVKKASGNMAGNAAVAAAQASSSMKKSSPDVKRNIKNRIKGISRAADKLAKEEVDLDEGIEKMSHARLKWHMNTGVPHGSYSKDEMKAERDRRLSKVDTHAAYKKAKPSLNEERVMWADDMDPNYIKTFVNAAKKKGIKTRVNHDQEVILLGDKKVITNFLKSQKFSPKEIQAGMESDADAARWFPGVNEAASHGNMNNGSPAGEGLSPSAKKELARKTPMPDIVNEPAIDKKTFDAIRASGKKAPMRNNDNAKGDKNVINKPMDITAKAPKKEDDGFKDS